ncbi:hypothetical protein AKJ16_DCAP25777 [Drosera capensis]
MKGWHTPCGPNNYPNCPPLSLERRRLKQSPITKLYNMASLFLSGIQFSGAVSGDLSSSYSPVPRLRVHRPLSSSVVASSATLYGFCFWNMDPSATRLSLYPLHRTTALRSFMWLDMRKDSTMLLVIKTPGLTYPMTFLMLALHHLDGTKYMLLLIDMLFDSDQVLSGNLVDNLCKHVRETGLLKKIELVVTPH